jgi:Rps23 Pro-64 3,4-dihydroxylase Tpa1-like proline 4-hydroxylase
MYHSIYGTSYFKVDFEVDRKEVEEIIGKELEELVYFYCNLENRTQQILEHKFDEPLQKNLYILEYSNLLDQLNIDVLNDVKIIQDRLLNHYRLHMDLNSLKNQLHIFDGKLSRSQLSHLHGYCLNSNYKLQQYSDDCFHEKDLRFSCHLSKRELENTQVLDALNDVCKQLGIVLFAKEYYINHYSQISYVSRHTDANVDGCVSILIFCNKYWEESWGGELKIYDDENLLVNKIIDFIPGRIIIFDSQIEHKVLPLTPLCKTDRFSLAIKAYTNPNHLTDQDLNNLIEIGVANI